MSLTGGSVQEKMREEYGEIERSYRSPYFGTFKNKLKKAGEEGLLLFTKYALVIILAYLALLFATNVVSGATNGTQSALYLQELQNKGYLPRVVNGVIPPKEDSNAKIDK